MSARMQATATTQQLLQQQQQQGGYSALPWQLLPVLRARTATLHRVQLLRVLLQFSAVCTATPGACLSGCCLARSNRVCEEWRIRAHPLLWLDAVSWLLSGYSLSRPKPLSCQGTVFHAPLQSLMLFLMLYVGLCDVWPPSLLECEGPAPCT
jgi:hypothetical protein